MKVYKDNIERSTIKNNYYRKVIFTTQQMQLVLMHIPTNVDIGAEVHHSTTQFIRVEEGTGVAIISNKRYNLKNGDAIIVPAGAKHNIISTNNLKLYTIYSPPTHQPNDKELHKGRT